MLMISIPGSSFNNLRNFVNINVHATSVEIVIVYPDCLQGVVNAQGSHFAWAHNKLNNSHSFVVSFVTLSPIANVCFWVSNKKFPNL